MSIVLKYDFSVMTKILECSKNVVFDLLLHLSPSFLMGRLALLIVVQVYKSVSDCLRAK